MNFILSPEIDSEIKRLIERLGFSYIKVENVISFKSYGSKSRAIARIWSLPRIWQIALKKEAHYCLEVISERFEKLSLAEKEKVLIHELLHIPKNFSGALLPHYRKGRKIDKKTVERLFAVLESKK